MEYCAQWETNAGLSWRGYSELMDIGGTGLQEMQRGFRVVLGIEDDIETGLHQCEAKQFALAGAIFDQEDGGVYNHLYIGDISRECAGLEDEELNY